MRVILFIAFLALCDPSFGEIAAWKPDPNETLDINDPRNQVLSAYRRALVLVRVQTYIKNHQSTPGDKEDILITDLQESVSIRDVTLATEYLKDYPDADVATELLLFQINQTSGIWPPWKRLALALFDRCQNAVEKVIPSLSEEKKNKFLYDVEFGISMSIGPTAAYSYPLTQERLHSIRSSIAKLKSQNKKP